LSSLQKNDKDSAQTITLFIILQFENSDTRQSNLEDTYDETHTSDADT